MSAKSIYVSGPYTAPTREGEDENIARAAAVAAELLAAGWMVFCPHTMSSTIARQYNDIMNWGWEEWLVLDIYWLSKCDAIYMLPGWRESKGAVIEYMVAKGLGLSILGATE